ncbi:MAG: leucine-rich repeat protein [Planctomycetota bacterium]|nr:leucine-rich repeat protein [Planctomycetota bacterium]
MRVTRVINRFSTGAARLIMGLIFPIKDGRCFFRNRSGARRAFLTEEIIMAGFYIRADARGFSEGPLNEEELRERVETEQFKRSGKISVDGNTYISAERVEDLLWDEPTYEDRFDKRSLYEKVSQRIYQPNAEPVVVRPPTFGETVKELFTNWDKPQVAGQHPFADFLRLNWQRLVPFAVIFFAIIVVVVSVSYLLPMMAYNGKMSEGTAALRQLPPDYRRAETAFKEALTVAGYENDEAAQRGVKQAQSVKEAAETRRQFEKLLKDGAEQFEEKNYATAERTFIDAMKLPSYANDLTATRELEKTRAALAKQNTQNQRDQNRYYQLIQRGEDNLAARRYQDAEDAYQDIIKMPAYANDPSVKESLRKVQHARSQEQERHAAAYDKLMKAGDAAERNALYNTALNHYQQAQTVPGYDGDAKARAGVARVTEKAQNAEDQFAFVETEEGADIIDYRGGEKDVVIPDHLGGFTVTGIGENAFAKKDLTGAQVPESVRVIGKNAFADNKIKRLVLPPSVVVIGESAFAGNQLTTVEIPPRLTSLNDGVFANNRLTQVAIPAGVKRVGNRAFANNDLTNVTFATPRKDDDLASDAFYGNSRLTIMTPDGNVFKHDGGYEIFERTVDRRTTLVRYEGERKPELRMAAKAGNFIFNEIGAEAFADSGVKKINIPKSVKSIGAKAFANCDLTEIELGAKVEIEPDAFDAGFIELYNQKKGAGKYVKEIRGWVH